MQEDSKSASKGRKSKQKHDSELADAMDEAELLIGYVCRKGHDVEPSVIKALLAIQQVYRHQGELSADEQHEFWYGYNQLVIHIRPATLASIQETRPSGFWLRQHPNLTSITRRVPLWYGLAICLVILITIGLQSYYMIGVDVLSKNHELFAERSRVRNQLATLEKQQQAESPAEHQLQILKLQKQDIKLDQEFDANRILLYSWNRGWQFGIETQAEFSRFDEHQYQRMLNQLKQQLDVATIKQDVIEGRKIQSEIDQLLAERKLGESRNLFFRGLLSASFVIELLEGYILPLLFGCLGAFTLVLRSLHRAFQEDTFTSKQCMDYNLRILLGGVSGITSGLLLNHTSSVPQEQFSPMMLAFLVGYNVEILFAIMDELAKRLAVKKAS